MRGILFGSVNVPRAVQFNARLLSGKGRFVNRFATRPVASRAPSKQTATDLPAVAHGEDKSTDDNPFVVLQNLKELCIHWFTPVDFLLKSFQWVPAVSVFG